MAVVYTPTLRGRRLALELRRLRERSQLTQAEAARRLSWHRSKLSRIEEPSIRPGRDDVRELLQLYGLDADRHDAILHLLEDSWQRGWWTAYGDAFTGNFLMLENQAPHICGYEQAFIPGLLQTADYARTVISDIRDPDEYDLDRLVAARIARQAAVLDRQEPPEVHFVIGEAAFRQIIGNPDLMLKQASAVWSAAVERPNVTVQVLPFTAALAVSLAGPFTLFQFPEEPGLDVAHSEGQLGEWYAEAADQLSRTRVAFDSLCSAAMSPQDSVAWLAARTWE